MDYRLDLFNAVTNYQDNMTANDALLVIAYNKELGDLIMGLDGDWEIISRIVSGDGLIPLNQSDSVKKFKYLQECILNIAANILNENDEYRAKFIKHFATGFVDIGATDYSEKVEIEVIKAPPSVEGE